MLAQLGHWHSIMLLYYIFNSSSWSVLCCICQSWLWELRIYHNSRNDRTFLDPYKAHKTLSGWAQPQKWEDQIPERASVMRSWTSPWGGCSRHPLEGGAAEAGPGSTSTFLILLWNTCVLSPSMKRRELGGWSALLHAENSASVIQTQINRGKGTGP